MIYHCLGESTEVEWLGKTESSYCQNINGGYCNRSVG